MNDDFSFKIILDCSKKGIFIFFLFLRCWLEFSFKRLNIIFEKKNGEFILIEPIFGFILSETAYFLSDYDANLLQ